MSEIKEGKVIDYDVVSKKVIMDSILSLNDIELSPKALNRILNVIQNTKPIEQM